jgi:hypothetical protein
MSSVSAADFTRALSASSLLRSDQAASSAAGQPLESEQGSSIDDTPAVTVSLSDAAKAAMADNKDFATVAKDARALLDFAYQERGGALDEAASAEDWKKAFSSLDRRALFAIASNEGSQFSELEQNYAKKLLDEQRKDALSFGSIQSSNPDAARRAAVKFLDGVSDEEKASIGWTTERVAAQTTHEILSEPFAKPADDVTQDNPTAEFIKAAYAARAIAVSGQSK